MTTTSLLAAIVIMALLIVVVIFVFITPIWDIGGGIKSLGPEKDELCKTRSYGQITDIDNDGRDDKLCDSCVCSSGCHNDNDDKDGDGLPAICDADDKDQGNKEFDPETCPEDKLISLGKTWGRQCRPS